MRPAAAVLLLCAALALVRLGDARRARGRKARGKSNAPDQEASKGTAHKARLLAWLPHLGSASWLPVREKAPQQNAPLILKRVDAKCSEMSEKLDHMAEENRKLVIERDIFAAQLQSVVRLQAEQRERIDTLQRDLAKLLHDYGTVAASVQELTEIRRQLEANVRARTNELALLRSESSAQSQNAQKLLAQLNNARAQLADLQQQVKAEKEGHTQANMHGGQMKMEWAQKLHESQNQAHYHANYTRAQNEHVSIKDKCTRLQEEHATLQAQFNEARTAEAKLLQVVEQLKTAEEKLDSMRVQLDHSKRALDAKSSEGDELRARLSASAEAESQLSTLRSDNDRLLADNNGLHMALDAQKLAASGTASQLDQWKTKATGLEADLISARAKLEEKAESVNSLQQTVFTLESELGALSDKEEAGERQLADMRNAVAGLQAELEAARRPAGDRALK